MRSKNLFVFACLFLLVFAGFASAITGSIGNARMVLKVDEGDEVEKTILVKNVNDVSVDIELFVSGDLEDDIEIIDNYFTLLPGEEKRAAFVIKVKDSGTTTSNINVKFTPTDGGNGVGLTSTIIVEADRNSWFDGDDDEESDDESGEAVSDEGEEDSSVSVSMGGNSFKDREEEKDYSELIMTVVLVLVFLSLFVFLVFLLFAKDKKKIKK